MFPPLSHTACLKHKPLAVWQSSERGSHATWMARLLREGGWGQAAKGWRILWLYRNLFASRSCGYQCGRPRERRTDRQTKAWATSQREIQESRGSVRITNTLHQVETKNNSEEKPTIHKGPFILWAFLLHTHFTWWNIRPLAFISVGSFWFFPHSTGNISQLFSGPIFLQINVLCTLMTYLGVNEIRWKLLRLKCPHFFTTMSATYCSATKYCSSRINESSY